MKDQLYQETYAKAKKIAPHIDGLLRKETPTTRTAIELEARELMQAYEPGRVSVNNALATVGGAMILLSPMLIMAVGDLEHRGLREHAHLFSLGGMGVLGGIAISVLDNRYLSRLYRAYAYLSRGTSTTAVREESTASRIDVPYAKVNLENVIRS